MCLPMAGNSVSYFDLPVDETCERDRLVGGLQINGITNNRTGGGTILLLARNTTLSNLRSGYCLGMEYMEWN